MTCAYHAEIAAMTTSAAAADVQLANYNANPAQFIQNLIVAGAPALYVVIVSLHDMHQDISTYVQSTNYPTNATPGQQARIALRRSIPLHTGRLNRLNTLILALRGVGSNVYQGLGNGLF
jgi:hypothetical protein